MSIIISPIQTACRSPLLSIAKSLPIYSKTLIISQIKKYSSSSHTINVNHPPYWQIRNTDFVRRHRRHRFARLGGHGICGCLQRGIPHRQRKRYVWSIQDYPLFREITIIKCSGKENCVDINIMQCKFLGFRNSITGR